VPRKRSFMHTSAFSLHTQRLPINDAKKKVRAFEKKSGIF
jgi:hypothetical protein